jgi:hypothetical protein
MLRQKKRVKSTCLTSGIQDHDGDDIDNMLIHQLYTIYIMRRDEAKIIIEMLAGYPVISIGAVIILSFGDTRIIDQYNTINYSIS